MRRLERDDDDTAIRNLVQSWMDATSRGDLDEICDLMTEDAVFTVPGRTPFGKEEFVGGFRAMADMEFRGQSEILELQIAGDVAWTRNRIDAAFTGSDGKTTEKRAYTLTIYRKCADGRWRLHRDANLPA